VVIVIIILHAMAKHRVNSFPTTLIPIKFSTFISIISACTFLSAFGPCPCFASGLSFIQVAELHTFQRTCTFQVSRTVLNNPSFESAYGRKCLQIIALDDAASRKVKQLITGRSRPFCFSGLNFSVSTVEDSMTLADLKMRAFLRGGDGCEDELETRFSFFRAINERRLKGAKCLMACVYGPFDVEILPYLCSRHELSSSKDLELMSVLRSFPLDDDKINAATEKWRLACTGRRIVFGCVDCSMHEFLLSPAWKSGDQQSLYISDMAIHPAFQGVGLGRRLLQAVFEHASSEGFEEMFLHVEERNTRAQGLYLSEGFVAEPDTPAARELYEALRFDEEHKNILMRRPVRLP
jgi:GNAT superfamily N-acetyltransferase